MTPYTVGTGFSGIGVPDLAARLLGMRTIWQIEKNEFCQKVLRKNFPEVDMLIGDIFDAHNLPHVDIGVFGFPCQPFSVAGRRQGERDERYLVPEMLRIIDETRPRVVLLENVPGFASIDDGNTFKRLLGALAAMGMDAEWGHIRASDFGAPHQRERIWIISYTTSAGRRGSVGGGGSTAPIRTLLNDGFSECGTHVGDTDQPKRQTWGGDGMGTSRAPQPFTRNGQMGDATSAGLEGREWSQRQGDGNRPTAHGSASAGCLSQPRLGRVIDGFTCGLDGFTPYPARPGELQYDFEPPRTTDRKTQRRDRLTALGNTMAFDAAFALMAAIKSWLVDQDTDGDE